MRASPVTDLQKSQAQYPQNWGFVPLPFLLSRRCWFICPSIAQPITFFILNSALSVSALFTLNGNEY
jgi:hypothetical protein